MKVIKDYQKVKMVKKVEKYKASKTAYLGHVTREINRIDDELKAEETNVQMLEELLEKLEAK